VLDLIAERIVTLKTERGALPRVYQEMAAEIPLAPLQPLPYLHLFLAIAAGLAAPFGLAVVKEQLTRRVSDASSAERVGHLSILGEIAQLPTRNRKGAVLGQRESFAGRVFEESIEALRTNLMLGHVAGSLRTMVVASAATKEGKTSVTAQLAASIARASSSQVLVIDGDLRDPALHSVFQLRREPGVVNVLAGDCTLLEAVIPSRTPGVDVLPAGALRASPHTLMADGRWDSLLKQVPPDYQFVIVDTPPVLAASEALIMARAADAVVLCVMRDVTRLPQLKKATERMVSAGAKIAGLVFNGIPTSHYAQRYGNYYPYLLS
jgi:capsular exopolysaccharide synthesis family protein